METWLCRITPDLVHGAQSSWLLAGMTRKGTWACIAAAAMKCCSTAESLPSSMKLFSSESSAPIKNRKAKWTLALISCWNRAGAQSDCRVRSEAFICLYEFARICLEHLFVLSEKVSGTKYLDSSEKTPWDRNGTSCSLAKRQLREKPEAKKCSLKF